MELCCKVGVKANRGFQSVILHYEKRVQAVFANRAQMNNGI